jgi:hypothetical protein
MAPQSGSIYETLADDMKNQATKLNWGEVAARGISVILVKMTGRAHQKSSPLCGIHGPSQSGLENGFPPDEENELKIRSITTLASGNKFF